MEPTMDDVVQAYIELRNQRDQFVAKHKEDLKDYNEKLDKMEAWFLAKMSADKVKHCGTAAGTVYMVTKEAASVVDMDAMLDYIQENNAWHLLEKRVSTRGVRELLEEGHPLPPGVNWFTKLDVNVRRASER